MNKILLFIGLIFILALQRVASTEVLSEKVAITNGISPFEIAKCLREAYRSGRDIYNAVRLWQRGRKAQAKAILRRVIARGGNTIRSCKSLIALILAA